MSYSQEESSSSSNLSYLPETPIDPKPNIKYVDPAICSLINRLKDDLEEMCKVVERQRDELQAVKFTPNSSVGLRLIDKCSALKAENEELDVSFNKEQLKNTRWRIACREKSNAYAVSLDREIEALQDELFACKKAFT